MDKITMIGYSINEYTRTFSDYGNRIGAEGGEGNELTEMNQGEK